ncbi:hypothetical protein [Treponema sp.]|uniref:hypothetical protein n=1 Tax=Treponema sp. TaxID=166 RepID=UPI003F09C862
MLSKIKNILSCLIILLFCSSCSSGFKSNALAVKEACKYQILISSDYSKWTPKAYAYFTYALDWFNTFDNSLCDMTNNIGTSDKDIDILGCWDSVYLNCPNINSIYENPKSIEKQYFSSICTQGLSFGKNHIGVLGGEIQSENDISFFFLYFLWKVENSKILIMPKYVAKYTSIEKSEISDISYFSTTDFIQIGEIEKFPIAFIQRKPFNFSKINITEKMQNFYMDSEDKENATMPEFTHIEPFRTNIIIIKDYEILDIEKLPYNDFNGYSIYGGKNEKKLCVLF